mmetsp:Transcript_36826/g.54024  ORF Transcript_36826/g.54024 Transcript_36826/m.54024 type:complete len:676 (+) Transcript_36826:231-2258(+)
MKLTRSISHEKFEQLERRLESESVQDLKYRLAKSRLPVDCPYIGNFHRGYKLCKRQFLRDADHTSMELSKCPYIDTTMFDCEPSSLSRTRPQKEEAEQVSVSAKRDVPEEEDSLAPLSPVGSVGSGKGSVEKTVDSFVATSSVEDKASGAVTPVMMFEKGPPPSPSAGFRQTSGDLMEAPFTSLRSRRRCAGQQVRSQSFSNVRDCLKVPVAQMPASPELCGLQAMLPRRCGLSVLSKLGEGSFGKVVLAINNSNSNLGLGQGQLGKSSRIIHKLPKTGVQVVLKCIKKTKCDKTSAESLCLEREVLIHARVDHINMPRMFGYYEDIENLTIILDLIPGKELKEVMVLQRTMPEHQARLICLQVARALEHLHSMRVVHRDVSPRNIMLDHANRAWLIDLGLAVDLDAKHLGTIESAGSLGYMPPEAQRAAPLATPLDMWALGTILYECMFGFSPFLAHELHMPSALVQFPDPDWGLHASEHVKHVMTGLLCKHAPERMSARALLIHDWADVDTLQRIDTLFAHELAQRQDSLETQANTPQMLAVDLLAGKFLGHSNGSLLAAATLVATDDSVMAGDLVQATAAQDTHREMQDAMHHDAECESLTALWSAVAWSSSARWSHSASYGSSYQPHAYPRVPSPVGKRMRSPRASSALGSLGLLRRCNSETDLVPLPLTY